jgi:PAS domain S-box-containing protein
LYYPPEREPIMSRERRRMRKDRDAPSVAGVVERLRAGDMLEAPLDQFISIFEAIDEKIYVADPDSHEMLYANRAMKKLFGEDVVGKKCHKVMQDLDEPCDFCTNPLIFGKNLGRTHIWEFKNRKLNKWRRCIDTAIRWSGGRMVRFEIAIDIHNRKVAEEALRQSDEKYRQLVENINEVIYAIDREGLITYVSPAITGLTGFLPSEIEGRHFGEFIFKDDFERIVGRFGEALSGQMRPTEYRILKKSGEYCCVRTFSKPIRDGGEVKGLQGVLADITEHKRTEAALRQSERRYRELLEAMNEGFRMVDERGIATYANAKLCSMLGYEANEIIGRSVGDFLDERSKEIWKREFEERAKGHFEPYEISHRTKDGGKIDTLVSPKPVLDERGRFRGSFSVITDITRLKRTEAALQAKEKELSIKAGHLEEMNAALRVLLKTREQDKINLEEKVLLNVNEHVIPYLEKLKKHVEDGKQKTYLDILDANIRGITSSFSRDLHVKYLHLTATELHIAELIREGKTSGEIANLMNVSSRTIESHRKNIRKKMGLREMKANLRATLMSIE